MLIPEKNLDRCDHCFKKIDTPIIDKKKRFCCVGCKVVYSALTSNGLEEYYKYKDKETVSLENFKHIDYSYMDRVEYQKIYFQRSEQEKVLEGKFYIEGIRCLACIWLFDQLKVLDHNILECKLNLNTSILKLKLKQNASVAHIACLINSFGYTPHVLESSKLEDIQKKENRKALNLLTIAFFCSGNIMLLSVAIYSGATGFFEQYFNFISGILAFPVLIYSGKPFYKNAYTSLKYKVFSIDLPIALALIIGFAASYLSLIFPFDAVYFDTLCMLVFLLLTSRYILTSVKRSIIGKMNSSSFFSHVLAKKLKLNKGFLPSNEEILKSKLESASLTLVHAKELHAGDIIRIEPGDTIPVDSKVLLGSSLIDSSVISGEDRPVKVDANNEVRSGVLNKSNTLYIVAQKNFESSFLGKFLKELSSNWGEKNEYSVAALSSAKIFFYLSLVLSLCCLIFISPMELAFERAIALIIITCPCALGVVVPITMIVGLSKMREKGLYVKNEAAIENAANIKDIFLDKTGTLTKGQVSLEFDYLGVDIFNRKIKGLTFKSQKELNKTLLLWLYHIEKKSNHPIARSFCLEFETHNSHLENLLVEDFIETHEFMKCKVDGQDVTVIKKTKSDHLFELSLNGVVVLSAQAEFFARDDAKELINYFKKNKSLDTISILSGDKLKRVKQAGTYLGLDAKNLHSELDPLKKLEIIRSKKRSLMIGDGVNDSLAMREAMLSIAVSTSVDYARKCADVYLLDDDLTQVKSFFESAKKVSAVLKRNIFLASGINLFFIYLTFTGFIGPFGAAVLMPTSSLIMLMHTFISLSFYFPKQQMKNDNYHVFGERVTLS